MRVYGGYYSVCYGIYIGKIFIDSDNNILGCLICESIDEEYFLGNKSFEALKQEIGLRVQTTEEFINCFYSDNEEAEIFREMTRNNFYETFPDIDMNNDDLWIKKYLHLNKIKTLNTRETKELIVRISFARKHIK